MATMYYLFFGVLFIAVCGNMDIVHHPVETIPPPAGGVRGNIIRIASDEIGIREVTGNNDGERVEQYLQYTDLGKGYAWCASFVSWCYGQAGLSEPRNPWSPALFPKAKSKFANPRICKSADIHAADIFGIYGQTAKRINHVGLVKNMQGNYLITIEGNSNNRVASRRRHLSTIYAIADWIGGGA